MIINVESRVIRNNTYTNYMRTIILSTLLLLLSSIAISQDIKLPVSFEPSVLEINTIDPFGSVQKVVTKDHALSPKTEDRLFVKVGRVTSIKKKKAFPENLTLYVLALPDVTVSVDRTSKVKVIFTDGTIKEYTNEGTYKVYGRDEPATIYFTLPVKDPLRAKKIKAVRFTCNQGAFDVTVPDVNQDLVLRLIDQTKINP